MENVNAAGHPTTQAPEDWAYEPERRYAEYQAQLADRYDLDVDSGTIDTDTADRIHYLEAGDSDGEPVLLLHGATGQAAYWLPMAPALTDRFRLYIPDMPGEGLSAKPSYRGRDLRSFLVAYLVEFLDKLGIDRPHVVGHSLGGGLAFLLAIDRDRVDRLCLVGAPVGLSRDVPLSQRLMTIRGVNRLLMWLLNRGDPIENAKKWIGLFVVDDSAVPERFYELYALRQEIPGLQESLRSLMIETGSFGRIRAMADLQDEIVGIESPTGFIWGSEDYYWEPEIGRAVAEKMPNAEFHELPDHGHTPWLEPSDAAQNRVRSFLDGFDE